MINIPIRLLTSRLCLALFLPGLLTTAFNTPLLARQQAPAFTRITTGPMVTGNTKSFGCGWVDADHDGDLDLFIANLDSPNALYQNEGNGTFSTLAAPTNADVQPSFGCSWGDYDNDGLDDLFIPSFGAPSYLYHNDGNNRFTRVTDSPLTQIPIPAQSGAWADYDNDGDLDLYVVTKDAPNILFQNQGHGTFTSVTNSVLVTDRADAHGIAWGDYDDDGDLDLFVANNYEGPNALYQNYGDGMFEAVTNSSITDDYAVSIGASWGDYDNDGDIDLFVANSLGATNSLYRNDGQGRFAKITDSPIVQDPHNAMGSCWGDYDNDGDIDLFVANSGDQANDLYRNAGNGSFHRVTTGSIVEDIGASRGCSWGDYDNDGDLDIFVTNAFGADDTDVLYRNEGTPHHWIAFRLIGTVSNRSAIGATVRIKANGVWQRRDVSSQDGAYGHNSRVLHFGLADATRADSVIVTWPSGRYEIATDLPPDQTLTLTEGQGFAEHTAPTSSHTAFVNVTVVPMDNNRLLPNHTVLIRDGRISAIAPTDDMPIPDGTHIIDGQGRYVMPGLADMHVHMFDPGERLLYIANGVTTVRNLHGVPTHLAWRDSIATGTMLGPRLLTSGPIVDGDPPTRPTNHIIRTPEEAAKIVRDQKAAGFDFIKIYDNVPRGLYEVLIETAREEQIPVVGHLPSPVGLEGLLEVNGQYAIEHIEELIPFFDDGRDLEGGLQAAQTLAEADVWLGPTLYVYMWPFRETDPATFERPDRRYLNPETRQRWRWATDPGTLTPRGQARRDRLWDFSLAFTKAFHDAGGMLLAGSDAPIPTMVPGFSLIEELRAFVEAGLSPYEALTTATKNAALFVDQPDAFGTITIGAAADLILLTANPLDNVDHTQNRVGVMVNGQWLSEAWLQARLEALVASYADH